mgnify:CR=1 FL=1
MTQNTPVLIARNHLKLVERLEARCEDILNKYADIDMHHVDQVAEDFPEALPNYMAITDLFSDCVAYALRHNKTTTTDYTDSQAYTGEL